MSVKGWENMSDNNFSVKKFLDAWRRGEPEYSNKEIQFLTELLASIRSELQLVDKTSKKRDILQWYLDIVKRIIEDYMTTRLLKSVSISIKKVEKISQDISSLSWFSAAIPEELDLTQVISHTSGNVKKTLAIVIRDVEKFVGEDGKEYGPYPAGSLINIPNFIARLLEEKRAIEEIFIT
ncbi:MAG: hypothetical protein QXR44_01470 [Thermoproteota archaeon]